MKTRSEETTIGMMQKDIGYLVKAVDGLVADVKALPNAYITQKDFSNHLAQFVDLQKQVTNVQRLVYIGLGVVLTMQFIILIYSNLHLK